MSWVGSVSADRASRPQAKHTDSTTRGQADQGTCLLCAARLYRVDERVLDSFSARAQALGHAR